MMHLRKVCGAALSAAVLVGAAGCGGSDETTTGTAASAAAKGKETIVFAVNSLPDNLTTSPWGGVASHVALSGLGAQLARYDTSSLQGGGCVKAPTGANVTGSLAKSITLSPDGKKITVVLRPLKSPAGNTLSGDDVAWSLERELKTDSVAPASFGQAGLDVESKHFVTVVDPTTVELKVKKPTSFTVESLVNNIANIYDSTEAKKHATAKDAWAADWLATHIADYSGWELESFTPGSALTVKANPAWGGSRGPVKRVVLQAVPSSATRQQLVQSGDADVANGLEFDQYAALKSAPGVTVTSCAGFTRDTLMLQTKTGPLKNPKVREALSLAINRADLVKGAYAGFGKPAVSSYPLALDFPAPSNAYTFDPTKAKALLAQAGYPDGFDLTVTFSSSRPGPVVKKSSVLLQSQLSEIGVKVKLQEVASPTDFFSVLEKGEYEALMYSEPAALTDPGFMGYVFLGSDAPNNTTGFKSAEYDEILSKLQVTPLTKVDERKAMMTQLAQISGAANPILYLVEVPNLVASATDVGPIVPVPNGQVRWNTIGQTAGK